MSNWCRKCGKYFIFGAYPYGFDKKIKGKDICMGCYVDAEKPYKLVLYDDYGNECGGCSIYKVVPKSNNKKIRLHNIAHYEYHLPGIRDNQNFVPIKKWNDIWNNVPDYYINPKWLNKFKGVLSRGICQYDGNGIEAIIEDKKKSIFFVNGVWG